jgi:hypothetical protein
VAKYNAEKGLYLICEGEGERPDFQTEAINNAEVLLFLWHFDPIPYNGLPLWGLAITLKDTHHLR